MKSFKIHELFNNTIFKQLFKIPIKYILLIMRMISFDGNLLKINTQFLIMWVLFKNSKGK